MAMVVEAAEVPVLEDSLELSITTTTTTTTDLGEVKQRRKRTR